MASLSQSSSRKAHRINSLSDNSLKNESLRNNGSNKLEVLGQKEHDEENEKS